MSDETWPSTSRPVGLLILLALAAVLYVLMLANVANVPSGGGEAMIGDAYAALFITFALWIVLAIMLIAGGLAGAMPGWAALSWIILVPLSGIANFIAIDMTSRHMRWAIVFCILFPPLIATYAFWARLTQVHGAWPPRQTSVAFVSAILLLSVSAMIFAL